ncbi:MAG TPA: AAA family ATPase, partial [Acidobacteriaceae bacterium]
MSHETAPASASSTGPLPPTWAEENQRALMAAIATIRQRLEPPAPSPDQPTAPDEALNPPAALDRICHAFALSPFERDLLLLCAGVELDSSFAEACARAHRDPSRTYPTFSLALATLPDPHWSALPPAAPLRRWRLVEVQQPATPLLSAPLRIAERVLHALTGIHYLDERLASLLEPVAVIALVPSHQAVAVQVAASIRHQPFSAAAQPAVPLVHLFGSDPATRQAIAAAACATLSLALYALDAEHVPQSSDDLYSFLRHWERETALAGCALYVETEPLDRGDSKAAAQVSRLAELLPGIVIMGAREVWRPLRRPAVWLETAKPSSDEQHQVWTTALGPQAATLNGSLHRLVSQFNLSAAGIEGAARRALTTASSSAQPDDAPLQTHLWNATCAQARPRLDDLAQRIDSLASWDDLVLPDATLQILREIAAQVAQRGTVYREWGFGSRSARGLGVSAMFAGSSGTGKTMAAEVLATSLHLDLYRIDLSSVVSKYIGETEK